RLVSDWSSDVCSSDLASPWCILEQEHALRMHQGDALLRIALTTCALDPASALTEAQRQWVLGEMPQRVTPFTAEERVRIREPLRSEERRVGKECRVEV